VGQAAPKAEVIATAMTKVTELPKREPPKSVSLSSLQITTKEKASGKHAADLRQVLQEVQKEVASALPTRPIEKPKQAPPPPVTEKPARPDDSGRAGGKEEKKETKPEVPEDVLRNMLKV